MRGTLLYPPPHTHTHTYLQCVVLGRRLSLQTCMMFVTLNFKYARIQLFVECLVDSMLFILIKNSNYAELHFFKT
jgi:hypothetical protein